MRFEDACLRLATLPDPLPQAPALLVPTGRPSDGRAASARERASRLDEPIDGAPSLRSAAVLVLVHPGRNGDAHLTLIERPTYDGDHSGEIAFPGGKAEPGDADDEETALREAEEEVGLDAVAAGVRVLGRLETVHVTVSGYAVTPVLALAERAPAYRPDPAEVARVLDAPLAIFLPDAEIRVVERRVRDWDLRYGIYPLEGAEVWGATARILGQLGAAVAAAGSP